MMMKIPSLSALLDDVHGNTGQWREGLLNSHSVSVHRTATHVQEKSWKDRPHAARLLDWGHLLAACLPIR